MGLFLPKLLHEGYTTVPMVAESGGAQFSATPTPPHPASKATPATIQICFIGLCFFFCLNFMNHVGDDAPDMKIHLGRNG